MPAIAGYTARRQVGALVLVPGDSCRAGTEQVVLLADSENGSGDERRVRRCYPIHFTPPPPPCQQLRPV